MACIAQKYTVFVVNFCAWLMFPSLFRFHVWALCPTGYYLNGLRSSAVYPHTYSTLKRDNAVIHKVTLTVTSTVTMKMSAIRLTKRVGLNASRLDIIWPAFTKTAATKLTALTSSDAARWPKVIFIWLTYTRRSRISSNELKVANNTEN